MTDFSENLHTGFIRLTEAGKGILLAVSGGRDSMALLHGTAQLRHVQGSGSVVVAHLNHGLRGDFSRGDAELVRSTSERLGLSVVISECTAGALQASSRGSLEESARNARYDFLRRAAIEHGLSYVATAHHAGDQAETVLHNIVRGTGLRGMRGIPEQRPLGDSVTLIRPLLTISPDEIERFIEEQQIVFGDDATNADTSMTRNRIRHQLLPKLRSDFNPQVDSALMRLSQQTGEIIDCLDALANRILSEATLEETPLVCRLDRELLRKWPQAVIRHAITVLWTRCGWPRQKMTTEHWTRLSEIIVGGREQSLDFPDRLRMSCSGRVVRIERSTQTRRANG